MATTGDWRDRWEERDRHGKTVAHVFCDNGKPIVYLTMSEFGVKSSFTLVRDLIPKHQPPRPKQSPFGMEVGGE